MDPCDFTLLTFYINKLRAPKLYSNNNPLQRKNASKLTQNKKWPCITLQGHKFLIIPEIFTRRLVGIFVQLDHLVLQSQLQDTDVCEPQRLDKCKAVLRSDPSQGVAYTCWNRPQENVGTQKHAWIHNMSWLNGLPMIFSPPKKRRCQEQNVPIPWMIPSSHPQHLTVSVLVAVCYQFC